MYNLFNASMYQAHHCQTEVNDNAYGFQVEDEEKWKRSTEKRIVNTPKKRPKGRK